MNLKYPTPLRCTRMSCPIFPSQVDTVERQKVLNNDETFRQILTFLFVVVNFFFVALSRLPRLVCFSYTEFMDH